MGNCDETLNRLYEYLDRELTADELLEIRTHLDGCPPCRERFTLEENFLRLVRRCCRDVSAPRELVERVKRLCES